MSVVINSIPDTQLGLSSDEIAILRHQQEVVLSNSGLPTSRAARQASSRGHLLLDSSSLASLGLHFDRLMREIETRLEQLSELSAVTAQQEYTSNGQDISLADEKIAHFHSILRQVDELEEYFQRVTRIRDIVRSFRQRVEGLETQLGRRQSHVSSSPSDVRTSHQKIPKPASQSSKKDLNAENVSVGRNKEREPIQKEEAVQSDPSDDTTTNKALFDPKEHRTADSLLHIVCIFNFAGCQSRFATKNAWVHHIMSKHLNVFWFHEVGGSQSSSKRGQITSIRGALSQKDLFYEILISKDASASANFLEEIFLKSRSLEESRDILDEITCPACNTRFQGAYCWYKMFTHILVHCKMASMGAAVLESQGYEDQATHLFVKWALKEGIIERGLGFSFHLRDKGKDKRHGGEEEKETALSSSPAGPFSDSGYASMGRSQDLNNENIEDDEGTVYTDDQELNIEEEAKKKLISTFSSDMIEQLYSTLGTAGGRKLAAKSTVGLLKEFSMKLQSGAHAGQQKDTSVFVRHYRHRIANLLETSVKTLFQPENPYFEDQEEADEDRLKREAAVRLSVIEKMQLWTRISESEFLGDQDSKLPDHDDEYEDYTMSNYSEAWKFLTESQAYKWLIGKLKGLLLLTEISGTAMEHISREIDKGLKTVDRSHGYNTGTCKGYFAISCDLAEFIKDEFTNETGLQLGSIITITGSGIDAQALTCAEYMSQVWPTGIETLNALQEAMDRGIGGRQPYQCTTKDNTQLNIKIREKLISVTVGGTEPAIVEIGQQLAWLGAALRSSRSDDSICTSEPDIEVLKGPRAMFRITFNVRELEPVQQEPKADGACWQTLFRNPVVVKGYPILARYHEERGLEIPLNIMAALGEASRITNFAGGLVVKGFSTLFCPTRLVSNSIQWHHLFEKAGNRISYLAADDGCPNRIRVQDLDTMRLPWCRNFLGWASSVEVHTGTQDAKYQGITWPRASFATAGVAFEKASIMAGSYLSGGASFTKGNKDTPIYIRRGGPYQQEIHSAYNMKVVLYDTGDRRAWLIDGASALLHITRTQLCSSPYSDSELLKIDNFLHLDPTGGALAAKKVLLDPGNRALVIFEDIETSVEVRGGVNGEEGKAETRTAIKRWTYQDLVRQTFHILEQIHDYETKILTSPTIGLRFTDREKLRGFAFMDIVDVQNDLRPRIATLNSSGRGWVDFARSIRAITLLGEGFGEIIKPSEDTKMSLCQNWKHVPKGQDYLVACLSTLKDICKRHGTHDSKLMELTNGIYWHKPDKLFEACDCKSGSCDRVQVLLPASFGSKRHPQPFSCDNGAVIFGRSRRFPWHWPSEGDPIEGGSSDQEDEQASEFRDSGLGSSLSQSARSPADLNSPQRSRGSDASNVSMGDCSNSERGYGLAANANRDILGDNNVLGQTNDTEAGRGPAAPAGTQEGSASAEHSSSHRQEGMTRRMTLTLRNRQPQKFSGMKRALDKVKGLDIIKQKKRKGKPPERG